MVTKLLKQSQSNAHSIENEKGATGAMRVSTNGGLSTTPIRKPCI